jgi:hypothetical protein
VTLDFIIKERADCIDFLVSISSIMQKEKVKITSRSFYGVNMTKMKILKIAERQNLTIAQMLACAIYRTAEKSDSFPEFTLEQIQTKH